MFSNAEKKVYTLLCENAYSYQEIMGILCISHSTLKTHLESICKKKKIKGCNRAEKLILDYWQQKVNKYKGYIKTLKAGNNDR